MLVEDSSFHEPTLRAQEGSRWPELSVKALLTLLRQKGLDKVHDVEPVAGKGNKRAASGSPEPSERPSKRSKGEESDSDIEFVDGPVGKVHLAVYKHTFHLDCVVKDSDKPTEDEKSLVVFVSKLRRPNGVDLGSVQLVERDGQTIVPSQSYQPCPWLLVVPPIAQDVDWEAHDYASPIARDLMRCIMNMRGLNRVSVDARLKLFTRDPASSFGLELEIIVSLITPTIFEPVPWIRTKAIYAKREDSQRAFLARIYPTRLAVRDGPTNIPAFYSILGAAPAFSESIDPKALQHPNLVPTLLPFQRRSVAFLLKLEGKTIDENGEVVPAVRRVPGELPLFWDVVGAKSKPMYRSLLTGALHASIPQPTADEVDPGIGGILAEEPGLGKTLESIALIMLNPAPERNPSISRYDADAKLDIKQVKTTLIVTPPTLASQWADELALHAPTLKVLIYEGWTKLTVPIVGNSAAPWQQKLIRQPKAKGKEKTEDGEVLDWAKYVNQFDVCITTYPVLQQDLTVAHAAPERSRRADVNYSSPADRPRSPLVLVEFYRVMMDEVQMVGGGKAEEMVSLIPRLSSFAVSGTPARAQVGDLLHVLKFLRVDNQIGPQRLWQRLLAPAYFDLFTALFRRYSVRTMKATVKTELTIPTQTRYLVPIQLGKVEKHVYEHQLESALLGLGLDARGVAAVPGWEIDATSLRTAIRKLRGLCTHPQVGQLVNGNKGEKAQKKGGIKTMAEVLEGMRDSSWRELMDERKAKIQLIITHAQLIQQDFRDGRRYRTALEILNAGEKETEQLITDVLAVVTVHEEKTKVLKEKRKAFQARPVTDEEEEEEVVVDKKGKGKARAVSEISSEDGDEEERNGEDDGWVPRTPEEKTHKVLMQAHSTQGGALKNRLRECRITLHRIKFLQGDVFHILGASHIVEENAAYGAADAIRRELLKTTEDAALKSIAPLDAASKGLSENSLIIKTPFGPKGLTRSKPLLKEANNLIKNLLNAQSELLWAWRSKLHRLLTGPLAASGEGDDDQDSYSRSLESQGEIEVYLQAYTLLLSDRREALLNERTLLAQTRGKERKIRNTKRSAEAAAAALDYGIEMQEDIVFKPEHNTLHQELTALRKGLLTKFNGRALKSSTVELSTLAITLRREKDVTPEPEEEFDLEAEEAAAKEAVKALQDLTKSQLKILEKFEGDLVHFRHAFNDRILYFRQLQQISDSVTDAIYEGTLADALEACQAAKTAADILITQKRAQQRYLTHLANNKDIDDEDEDDECILCKCEFEKGYISMDCAHAFCEDCLELWMTRKEGKSCPVCRAPMTVDKLQRFVVGETPVLIPTPAAPTPVVVKPRLEAPVSRRKIEYNRIDPGLLSDIEEIESHGSYGTKIQTLIQHLLYIKTNEPGAKSIVFSAWADSLTIVEHALAANGIRCMRVDQSRGKDTSAKIFRTDPTLSVLLLHGERQNSGLNVTCASRVFLLESVVHHGFELQAIARIDRMGQTRPTEVFCYFAEDTIERNILNLAAKQGLSLYTKDNFSGTVETLAFEADNKTIDAPAKKNASKAAQNKGDFIFSVDDMLAILFPHMYEDIEFLIPVDDETNDVEMTDGTTTLGNSREGSTAAGSSTVSGSSGSSGERRQVNAVAGPSRQR